MEYPTLNTTDTSREFIEVFGGYNHNLRINDGEFYDMDNLTSSHYPILAPRKQRGTYLVPTTKPTGMIWKDAFCYCTQIGTNLHFVMNNVDYDLGMILRTTDKDGNVIIDENTERTMISMGAYVIIMPDKKYINTIDTDDKGDIEVTYTSPSDKSVTFELCKQDGTAYTIDKISDTDPVLDLEDGEELEENFYKNPERGIDKRFFTIEDAMKYFSLVGQPDIRLKTINYIGKEKQIFEIIVGKILQCKLEKEVALC